MSLYSSFLLKENLAFNKSTLVGKCQKDLLFIHSIHIYWELILRHCQHSVLRRNKTDIIPVFQEPKI